MANFALFYEMRWNLSAYDGGSYDDEIPCEGFTLYLFTERYDGDQSCLIGRVEGRLERAAPIED